jgi:hypothetical protein
MEYFKKIEEPKKLRISLMIAARDSILVTSMLENFSNIKKEKSELILSLKDDFKEINGLCKQLSNLIADDKTRKEIIESLKVVKAKEDPKIVDKLPPSFKVKTEIKQPSVFSVPKDKYPDVKLPAKEEPKGKTEVDRLEYTLSQIEKKLADLTR